MLNYKKKAISLYKQTYIIPINTEEIMNRYKGGNSRKSLALMCLKVNVQSELLCEGKRNFIYSLMYHAANV